MNENHTEKKYESFKIPAQKECSEGGAARALPQTKTTAPVSSSDEAFYEIDYDLYPIKGVGKFVLKSQKIEPPQKDEIRDLFSSMREIAKAYRSSIQYSRFYDRRSLKENSGIFYKQGMFMKDFTDEYTESVPYSAYFPYYQMMGYEQLRTYFSWRTEVRKGNVTDTSLSYAFLYIYELLNNIGVDSPQDGLEKLMSFWNNFGVYNQTIDKYVLRWLKDYHIYYQLPHSFKEFIEKNDLTKHYPKIADADNDFDLFCAVSKYDIRKSVFYTDDTIELITDCFRFVIDKLKQVFAENEILFEECIFQPSVRSAAWTPFQDALFFHWMEQPDRRIVLSENEIYLCSQNNWTFNKTITTQSGKQLIGYIMKQMEAVLRKVTKYKFKLSANLNSVAHEVIGKLNKAGLNLGDIVSGAVMEFYREATKTVVTVDHTALSKIRQEALATQEKLVVPEQEEPVSSVSEPVECSLPVLEPISGIQPPAELSNVWEALKSSLSETEIQAIITVMLGDEDIKQFADENSVMVEVLVDGINEKAMDCIGDNLLDEDFNLYVDYIDQVKEMVG